MRRLTLAIALACVLTGMVRAGEIPTTGAVTPSTPCTVTADGAIHGTCATTPGEIPSTGETAPGEIPTTGEAALAIILTIISIVP